MNGIEFLRNVRASREFPSLPFVIATSQTAIEQVKTIQAAQAGVNGYLLKPFNLNSFKSQMDTILNELELSRRTDRYVVEARTLLGRNEIHRAIDILQEGIRVVSELPMLDEVLGDAYCALSLDKTGPLTSLHRASEAYEKALNRIPGKTTLVLKNFEVLTAMGRKNKAVLLPNASPKPRIR